MLEALRGKTFSRSAVFCLSITFAAVLFTSSVAFAADILYVVGKSTIKDSDKAVMVREHMFQSSGPVFKDLLS